MRKLALVLKIDKHPSRSNTISCELLWANLRNTEHSNLAIQNTLLHIPENYFKFFGGLEFGGLCAMLDGKGRLIYGIQGGVGMSRSMDHRLTGLSNE